MKFPDCIRKEYGKLAELFVGLYVFYVYFYIHYVSYSFGSAQNWPHIACNNQQPIIHVRATHTNTSTRNQQITTITTTRKAATKTTTENRKNVNKKIRVSIKEWHYLVGQYRCPFHGSNNQPPPGQEMERIKSQNVHDADENHIV